MRRLLALPVLLLAAPAAAQVDHDLQSWTRIGVRVPIAKGWTITPDAQLRYANDLSRESQFNARVFIDHTLSDHWSIALGYHHAEDLIDGRANRVEHRAVEGVTWTPPDWHGVEPQVRFRLEQRWRSDGDDRQDRARLFARIAAPIAAGSAVKLVAWEETFFVSAADWRPRSGFEQQRFYGGVQVPIGKVQAEAGYMNQIADDTGPAIAMTHVLLVGFTFRP